MCLIRRAKHKVIPLVPTIFKTMKPILIYCTFPDTVTAQETASAVIGAKLAACANIFPAHISLYEWQGDVKNEEEVAVIFKSTDAQFAALKAAILDKHPYETPCIVALPITDGHAPFLEWVAAQSSSDI